VPIYVISIPANLGAVKPWNRERPGFPRAPEPSRSRGCYGSRGGSRSSACWWSRG